MKLCFGLVRGNIFEGKLWAWAGPGKTLKFCPVQNSIQIYDTNLYRLPPINEHCLHKPFQYGNSTGRIDL